MTKLELPVRIRGVVAHGDKRGRGLGFPTANLISGIPVGLDNGVYASETVILGDMSKTYASVTSFGTRPTFDGADRRIETHILDFHEDIYDREIEVSLLVFLRPERRFASVKDLVAAMRDDIIATRSRTRS